MNLCSFILLAKMGREEKVHQTNNFMEDEQVYRLLKISIEEMSREY